MYVIDSGEAAFLEDNNLSDDLYFGENDTNESAFA